jgi:7-cyano-7-deazaguanine synthase in queuosine biosynthesis
MSHREVVIWSGGLDSTLALHKVASREAAHGGNPVVALTVEANPQLDERMLKAQFKAQQAYLSLAKKRGFKIKHLRVRITASENIINEHNAQTTLWFAMMMPYIVDGDVVHLGYIRKDDFWHYRAEFAAAFHAMCRLQHFKAKLVFDMEWNTKDQIVEELRHEKIPLQCTWTCESPLLRNRKIVPCERCSKCVDLSRASTPLHGYEEDKEAEHPDDLPDDLAFGTGIEEQKEATRAPKVYLGKKVGG